MLIDCSLRASGDASGGRKAMEEEALGDDAGDPRHLKENRARWMMRLEKMSAVSVHNVFMLLQ